ncbi:hypothetical protein LIER_10412 [Lithospermum erythrorhizon]|uniref:Bulb-type lectin domain-containing protein n=1 Tax=Lithospermum erythrorhizon TaxID=34254 RepID=A0AAV3PKF6_LITER
MKIYSSVFACFIFIGILSEDDSSLVSSVLEFPTSTNWECPAKVVWVANRENPLKDASGVLRIGHDLNLVILDASGKIVWKSANITYIYMEIGSNNLTSWKSSDDPSSGKYTYGVDTNGHAELVISERLLNNVVDTTGPWNGMSFGEVQISSEFLFAINAKVDEEDAYYC